MDKLQKQYEVQVKAIESFKEDKGDDISLSENISQYNKMLSAAVETGETMDLQERVKKINDSLNAEPEIDMSHLGGKSVEQEYENNFEKYFRETGLGNPLDFIPKNVLEVGTDSKGGFLVPETWEKRLIKMLNDVNTVRQYASVKRSMTTTNIPIQTGRPVVQWIKENGTYPESDSSFGNISIGAHKMGGIMKVSEELLADSMFDISMHISEEFVHASSRLEESSFVNGDGVDKPTGLLTGIPAAMQYNTAASSTVSIDDILKLPLQIHRRLEDSGMYFMSRSTATELRTMKDGQGQYLWQPSLTAGKPNMFNGKSVVILEGLGNMSTVGGLPVLFGDLMGYKIYDRSRSQVQVLREMYAPVGQIGYRMYHRVDAKMVDTQRLVSLKVKA